MGGGPDPPVPRLSVRPPYQGGGNVLKQGGGILENRSVLSRGEKRVFFTPKNEGFWPPPGGAANFTDFDTPGGVSVLMGRGMIAALMVFTRCASSSIRRFYVSHEYQFYFSAICILNLLQSYLL